MLVWDKLNEILNILTTVPHLPTRHLVPYVQDALKLCDATMFAPVEPVIDEWDIDMNIEWDPHAEPLTDEESGEQLPNTSLWYTKDVEERAMIFCKEIRPKVRWLHFYKQDKLMKLAFEKWFTV